MSEVEHSSIIVIDDNADVLDAVVEALEARGYQARGFRNAAEALLVLEDQPTPALIVLDLMMPEMDGWTFRVRQRASSTLREVPVVVMTASGSSQAEAIDADAFVRKPMSIEQLCSVVEQTLASAERKRLLTRSMEIERLRSLGMLVASVAHEINNPLAYVSGHLDLAMHDCGRYPHFLSAEALVSSMTDHLSNARQGASQIENIVRSLLVFARSEANGRETADLARALEGAIRMATGYARSRATIRKSFGALPLVHGPEARLSQVFLNLLINAAQAITPGRPDDNTISVSAFRADERVVIEIADTGCGIDVMQLEHIFEPFYTTKPAGEGTGLGLSICKQLVESAGGTIAARSCVGEGTAFTVTLKVATEGPFDV